MADERQEFTFSSGNLSGITSEDLIEAGESFLNSDPEDLIPVQKGEEKKEEEIGSVKKKDDKSQKKDKPEVKEVIIPENKVEEDDIYSALEGKINEDDSDEKEETTSTSQANPGEKQEGDGEENVFNTIAKELVTLGVFSQEEDEEGNPTDPSIDSPEAFAQRFQVESRKQAADVIDKFLERFGDDYKDMFENVFVKGVSPKEYLNRFTKVESIDGLDLTNEDNQERIVRELLRTEGRSAEYIDKKIVQMRNYGDLSDEATEAKRLLIDREKREIERSAEQKQAELVSKQQAKNQYFNNVSRILQDKLKSQEFDGIPVNRKFAEQTLGYITEERYQTPDRQLLTEFDKDLLDLNRPENHALKVKVAMLLQMAKEDPQLSKLAKKAVSKESSLLFQGIKKTANKTTSSPSKKEETQESKSWFDQ